MSFCRAIPRPLSSLAIGFRYSDYWGLTSATHSVSLPEAKPRAGDLCLVVPSICRC